MNPILQARGLTREYRERSGPFGPVRVTQALRGVDLALDRGRTLAVVGESGCGKSTLARIVTMIDAPSSGELLIDGRRVDIARRRPPSDLRRMVRIVFQNPQGSLNPRQRVGHVLMEQLYLATDLPRAARRDQAMAMLHRVGLQETHFDRYPHMFSGGQRQRVAIARALMVHPRLLVLDEPVSALDLSVQAQVLNLLVALQREFDLAYMFISHDLSVVRHIADEVMVMYRGEVVERGARDAVFSNPQHDYTRALFRATPLADAASVRARLARKQEAAARRTKAPTAQDPAP